MRITAWPHLGAFWLLGSILLVDCTRLSDPSIDYRCLPPATPYLERFEGSVATELGDRCWSERNALEGDVEIGQGDLVIAPARVSSLELPPPMLVRPIEGDFVIVTKTETQSGLNSDHCGLTPDEASGIVMLGDGVRLALLVRPYLEAENIDCMDNDENPPRAFVFNQSSELAAPRGFAAGVGFDGETEIAVCRKGESIAYFYRQPTDPDAAWMGSDWQPLRAPDEHTVTEYIGPGPVDVGLMTTISIVGKELEAEGHFNWVDVESLAGDCRSPLEELQDPEVE